MTVEIDRAFRRKCETDERLRFLLSQWEYDQHLVGQALGAVALTFPHYSRHDASHSSTILVQIARVLGEDRIEKLSATDLWFLLEAAYWHDLGMVVDDNTLRRWWKSKEFENHITALRLSQDPDLAKAAETLDNKDPEKLFDREHWPLHVRRAVTLVVADFARQRHATRSREIVTHPLSIGLSSPRVVIPERLFHWLGKVAEAHGQSRDEVMKLPASECGLGTDLCHPRFIACMLRFGDLLDLDNTRFCPVLTSAFGSLPPSSLDHVGKHASIRRFVVSPERIAVEAVCRMEEDSGPDPYGAYEAVSAWLGWLRDEVRFLASRWSDIAPPDFGGAPSLGRIQAELTGFISLEEGQRPRFRVDEPAFLALVRSNNLYRQRHAWIRELVANADDATRIRVHEEKHDEIQKRTEQVGVGPFELVQGFIEDYSIAVHVQAENETCKVIIGDQGTGISREDLGYILTIGSSRRNPERQKLIRKMPESLKPTGSFGIGLQSVFMVADTLDIRTMHHRTRDRLRIIVRRGDPEDADDGAVSTYLRSGVYISELGEEEEPLQPGTHVTVTFKTGKGREDEESFDDEDDDPYSNDTSDAIQERDHDPVAVHLTEVEQLRRIAEEAARSLLTPVSIDGADGRHSQDQKLFHSDSSCYVEFGEPELTEKPIRLYYRGSRVPDHRLGSIGLVDVTLDLHSGSASDVLTTNRRELTEEGEVLVRKRLWSAIGGVFKAYLHTLREGLASSDTPPGEPTPADREKWRGRVARASLFARVYLDGRRGRPRVDEDPDWYGNEWRQVELLSRQGIATALSGLGQDKDIGIVLPARTSEVITAVCGETVSWYQLNPLVAPNYVHEPQTWIRETLLGLRGYASYLGVFVTHGTPEHHFVLSPAAREEAVSSVAFEQALREALNEFRAQPFRPILPCPKDFSPLAVNPMTAPEWTQNHPWILPDVLISPLEFVVDSTTTGPVARVTDRHFDDYVRWVERHGISEDDTLRGSERKEVILAVARRFADFVVETFGSIQTWPDSERFRPDAIGRDGSL